MTTVTLVGQIIICKHHKLLQRLCNINDVASTILKIDTVLSLRHDVTQNFNNLCSQDLSHVNSLIPCPQSCLLRNVLRHKISFRGIKYSQEGLTGPKLFSNFAATVYYTVSKMLV